MAHTAIKSFISRRLVTILLFIRQGQRRDDAHCDLRRWLLRSGIHTYMFSVYLLADTNVRKKAPPPPQGYIGHWPAACFDFFFVVAVWYAFSLESASARTSVSQPANIILYHLFGGASFVAFQLDCSCGGGSNDIRWLCFPPPSSLLPDNAL